MLTKLDKLEKLIHRKNPKNKNNLYAQIIKNHRIQNHYTLSEMAKGICSISYLCKFERNAIDAEETYIRMLFERMHLDFEKVGKNIVDNGIVNCLKAYLYMNWSDIESVYHNIDDSLYNSDNYLIKAFYFLIRNDYQAFSDCILTLDEIKENLSQEDIGIMMFLVIEYYCKTYQFREARRYLELLTDMIYENKELNWLLSEQYFTVGFNLHIYPMVYRYYYRLISNHNMGYPNFRQMIVRMKLLYLEAEEYFADIYEQIKPLPYPMNSEATTMEIIYWKYAIMTVGGLWVDVHDEIVKNVYYTDVRFMGLLFYVSYLIGDETILNDTAELAKNCSFDDSDPIHQKFIRFMIYKQSGEKLSLVIEYLRRNILPYNKTYTHFLYSHVYETIYQDYLVKTSKYKEAFYMCRN